MDCDCYDVYGTSLTVTCKMKKINKHSPTVLFEA